MLEVFHCACCKCYKKYGRKEGYGSIKKTMTESEFNAAIKKGRKLALYNEYVINMFWYFGEHPGGQFLLDRCVGSDLGCFMDGSATNSDAYGNGWMGKLFNGKPHTHSQSAYRLMRRMAIARLVPDNENDKGVWESGGSMPKDADSTTDHILVDTDLPKVKGDKALIWTVTKKENVNDLTYRYVFETPGDLKVFKYYPGFSLSGKGFTLTSLKTYKNRYYTICNAMGSQVYEEYGKIVDSICDGASYD